MSCDWFAYKFGDPAFPLFRLVRPFPVFLSVGRTKLKIATYPQAERFAVEKMAHKFAEQTNTASTPCMEAVKIVRGRGREEESAARSMCVSTITCR